VRDVKSQKQKDASLMYFKLEEDIDKSGKINDVIVQGQEIVVQIAKEPISTKGPRISSEISIAGRYLVLVPFSDRISVSQKIKNPEEKSRLKNLMQSIKPKNFGVIVRTVAENKKVVDLETDLKNLVDKWDQTFDNLKDSTPPHRILGELDRATAFLRDMLNSSYNNIHVNDHKIAKEIRDYLHTNAPDKESILKEYKGNQPIFETFGVDRQIKSLFGKTVNIKSGAYLVIEHTEALHVIDVNSGNRANSKNTQEDNALEVNIEAAEEIARQLRLRDMGGIIVVDFIDLNDSENRKTLYNKMKEFMATDKAKHTVLPPTKFGLIQITRQRVRPEMDIDVIETCPACNGTGKIEPSVLLVEEIENNLRYIYKELNPSSLYLNVHPFLHAYLTSGFLSHQMKWFLKFKKRVKIVPMNSFHMVQYEFLDANNNKIKL
jgi:ribonuclease G